VPHHSPSSYSAYFARWEHLESRRLQVAGDLDPTFGDSGRVLAALSVNDVVVQPDGKVLVAGTARVDGTSDGIVARYNADGSLDASFGTGGVTRVALDVSFSHGGLAGIDQGSVEESLRAFAFDADGKIVAVGEESVLRVNVTGSADPQVHLYDSGELVINGTALNDRITVTSDGTTMSVAYRNRSLNFDSTRVRELLVDGRGGDDRIVLGGPGMEFYRDFEDEEFDQVRTATIIGSGGDDTLAGGDEFDVIAGGSGNDVVFAGAGTGDLAGNEGEDTITGGDEADVISGGTGHDVVFGGSGNDTLTATTATTRSTARPAPIALTAEKAPITSMAGLRTIVSPEAVASIRCSARAATTAS